MLTIKNRDEIKNSLLSKSKAVRNFPKTVSFPFDPFYKDIITQIKSIEISAECILFDSVESFNETKEFTDPEYWTENYSKDQSNEFWFFAQNGQGDYWLFDDKNKVYFYDHNQEQMCRENFIDLDLNFEKWLQFSYLNKQYEEYDLKEEVNEEIKTEYKNKLREISKSLLDNYPFEI